MKILKTSFLAWTLTLSLGAFAQEDQQQQSQEKNTIRQEQRETMAAVHEKMAECLRSDKDMAECRQIVQKSMGDMKGMGMCPMTGEEMGQMHGQMHGQKRTQPSE